MAETTRHIPEEELHAYLDQALSRSQCVEIEHHLSGCRPCRTERDAIAALRDRTTAILVTAAPRRIRPRPYTELSATHVLRNSRRSRRLQRAVWAASVMAALGLGWALSQWSASSAAPDQQQASAPETLVAPTLDAALPEPAPRSPRTTPVFRSASTQPTGARSADPSAGLIEDATAPAAGDPAPPPRPATSSLASLGSSSSSEPVLSGLWRTVNPGSAAIGPDEWVPRVEGVPVVQVKVRQASEGGRPITLVTQQLANGEMISTVEGPATEVAELLSQQPGQSASAELQDMQAASRAPGTAGAPATAGSAPRTLAIFGSAPSDSLKAFMLRVK